MSEPQLCKICGKRRPRRACPAVAGDICSICCGTEREVSLNCPLDCTYLKEAYSHEKTAPPRDALPYPEIDVPEELLYEQAPLIGQCINSLADAALEVSGVVDSDVLAALAAAIQTRKTLDSGLIYESQPENALAMDVQRKLMEELDEYSAEKQEQSPLSSVRNSDVIKVLVFVFRIGETSKNDRPKGRRFIHFLLEAKPKVDSPLPPEMNLIV